MATAINQLDERERIILTLHYYEKLSFADVAGVLGVDEGAVLLGHRGALHQIRTKITEPVWARLEHLARTTPASPDTIGALALIHELAAA